MSTQELLEVAERQVLEDEPLPQRTGRRIVDVMVVARPRVVVVDAGDPLPHSSGGHGGIVDVMVVARPRVVVVDAGDPLPHSSGGHGGIVDVMVVARPRVVDAGDPLPHSSGGHGGIIDVMVVARPRVVDAGDPLPHSSGGHGGIIDVMVVARPRVVVDAGDQVSNVDVVQTCHRVTRHTNKLRSTYILYLLFTNKVAFNGKM